MTTSIERDEIEAGIVDHAPRFDDEKRDQLAEDARDAVHATPAGVADQFTGSVSLDKTPEDGGAVVEYLDEEPVDEDERAAWGLRPIIPESLTDPGVWRQRRAVLANRAAFHTVRSPVYLWRAVSLVGIGARVGVRDAWSYLFATEFGEIADKVRRVKADPHHIADLRADRRKEARERRREAVTVYAMTGFTTYTAALLALGQTWGMILAAPALIPVFGVLYFLGRREMIRRSPDLPFAVLDNAAEMATDGPVTDERITRALRDIKLMSAEQEIKPSGLATRDELGNTTVEFKTPAGLVCKAIKNKAEQFAGALGLPVERLDIEQGETPNDVILWVAATVPFSGEAPISPLVTAKQWDIWNGVPFGGNRKGVRKVLQVLWSSLLFGGAQGYGKTSAMRLPAAAGALDPHCRMLLADFKGGADWEELEEIAHRVIIGADPASVEEFIELIDELIEEMDDRFAKIRRMPKAQRPDMRLTPEMAETHDMPVLMLLIDEIQEAFGVVLARKDGLKEFAALVEKLARLIRRGRACGLIIIAAAQRPSARSVPTDFRDVILKRYSVHTVDDTSSDMILGDGQAKRGHTAAGLGQIGVGILAEESGSEKIMTDWISPQHFTDICARGRALRIAAGTLTGYAASGLLSVVGILAEIRAAFDRAGVDELGSADIARLLHDQDPAADWGQREGESDRAWSSRVGARLGREIEEALDGSGRTLDRVKVTTLAGTEGRGFRREDLNLVLGA
ncbi:FtsK/SpoIIIE domain-containing protein [Streptomyces sp. DG2A-72]|uniref:FtsK/SpoIIIE domain-containing protein n=1 Tax=Streptomyces sp. DG2A-72 TaxID=3051386 RepID=UPI00265BEB7D|nr:FtsK/SpoIIIE domain-containing protein [Streptomyces sp. DG2A-72]MDO0939266.1 FtsK/SpoIIIE domain-containing protein [Streptomyces sp. DG2A-72]